MKILCVWRRSIISHSQDADGYINPIEMKAVLKLFLPIGKMSKRKYHPLLSLSQSHRRMMRTWPRSLTGAVVCLLKTSLNRNALAGWIQTMMGWSPTMNLFSVSKHLETLISTGMNNILIRHFHFSPRYIEPVMSVGFTVMGFLVYSVSLYVGLSVAWWVDHCKQI